MPELPGGVVHDFNNLLLVIGGHAELILASPDDDVRVERAAAEIERAAQAARALTQQLLQFSRAEPPRHATLRQARPPHHLRPG